MRGGKAKGRGDKQGDTQLWRYGKPSCACGCGSVVPTAPAGMRREEFQLCPCGSVVPPAPAGMRREEFQFCPCWNRGRWSPRKIPRLQRVAPASPAPAATRVRAKQPHRKGDPRGSGLANAVPRLQGGICMINPLLGVCGGDGQCFPSQRVAVMGDVCPGSVGLHRRRS